MVVAKGLLLKGLGVCAICAGGATTVALKWGGISGAFSSSISRKKIVWGGLECEDADGSICSLSGEIFIKKKTGTKFKLTGLGEGKIKVYKAKKEGDDGYNEGFKFLIEDNDISGVGEGNKLEEFESYEVKKGTETDGAELKDQYFLSQKTDVKEEIKKALGLPWALPEGETEDHTNINDEQLKTIKFKGGAATITGESVTLTITKESTKTEYPLGYKFTFKNTATTPATLKIGKEAISIKKTSPIDYDFKIKRNGSSLSLEKAWSLETFTEKIGLVKDGDFWDVGTSGLNVKVDTTTKKENKTKKDGTTGKIKVYEGQTEYNGGFKFTIEEGDLILEDSGSPDITLEEFQSYEIVKEEEKFYLSKKEEAKEGIKRALGLTCEFTGGQNDCSLTSQNIKTIKFKEGDAALSGGTVTLTVSTDTSKTEYPYGFKFSFKNSGEGDATLKTGKETLILKKNSPVEFKIKKEGSSISLEKAWTLETLTQKVGLKKEGEVWNVGSTGLNIKQDSAKHTNKTRKIGSDYGNGNIRVYESQAGYNEGFRFILEDGDITLNNGGSTTDIVLGQFQSYEIVKEEDKWYLSKKEDEEARIKELLGFKNSNCEFPKSETPAKCDLTNENIKTIKFDGAGDKSATVDGSPKLTISKTNKRLDFPLGYKFVFSSESNSTITIPTTPPLTIKGGLSVDYKIKRNEKNKNLLSLGKAWDPDGFMRVIWFKKEKDKNEWVAGNESVNIIQDSHKTTSAKAVTNSNHAKIRVYEGFPGYKHGMKFMVEDGDTTFSEGGDIKKLTKYETYEISEETNNGDNTWYISRKQKAEDSMRELLGLPETCKMPTNETPLECTLDDSKLKAVKFEGKGNGELTITGSGSVTVKISKESSESEFPKGFKFTFKPGNKSFTIPQDGGSIVVNSTSNTEFKIKESGNTLTLEKVG